MDLLRPGGACEGGALKVRIWYYRQNISPSFPIKPDRTLVYFEDFNQDEKDWRGEITGFVIPFAVEVLQN